MDLFAMVIIAFAAITVFTQVRGIAATYNKIKLPARMPGRRGAKIGLIALAAVAVFRWQDVYDNLVLFACIAIVVGIYLFIVAGLSPEGVYYNGRLIPCKDIEYFILEREHAKGLTYRFHTHSGADYILCFRPGQRDEVNTYLQDLGIVDWDSFHFKSDDELPL